MLSSSNLLPIMVLPLVLVFAGTTFQTSTGLGLTLIAWPGFLLVMDSVVVVQVAVMLNFILTTFLLLFELKEANTRAVSSLIDRAALGLPKDFLVLNTLDTNKIWLFCGVLISLTAL